MSGHHNAFAAGKGPSLLGRNWLSVLSLDWNKVNHINHTWTGLQGILDWLAHLFKEDVGRVRRMDARFLLKTNQSLYKVEDELEWLEKARIIDPMNWAAPIVPLVKREGTVSICSDLKLTVNKQQQQIHQLEDKVESCNDCPKFSHLPATAPLQPSEWLKRRVHVDYAGYFWFT